MTTSLQLNAGGWEISRTVQLSIIACEDGITERCPSCKISTIIRVLKKCLESVQMHYIPVLTSALSVLYMPHAGGSISRMIVVVGRRRVCENVHVW
jgi:hypothetical protein